MLKRALFIVVLLLSVRLHAQECPGEDNEPALKHKTAAGPELILCGNAGEDGTYTDFKVYAWPAGAKQGTEVFASDVDVLYTVSKDMKIVEQWTIGESLAPAVERGITCTKDKCQVAAPKCAWKMKKNPFPKALAALKKGAKDEEGEDLLDQVLAQAIGGDKAALEFFAHPPKFDASLADSFAHDKQNLELARKLCK